MLQEQPSNWILITSAVFSRGCLQGKVNRRIIICQLQYVSPSPRSCFWTFLQTQSFRDRLSVTPKAKAALGPGVSESQGVWSSR
jgi:hypothetical protein